MARSRNVKPGFFTNEDLADLGAHTRLLFIGLWTIADRRGILEDRPRRISGEIFRYEQIDCEPLLAGLAEKGFIQRYEADGIRCIFIPKFGEHQNPHVKEQANTLPAPDMPDASTGVAPDVHGSSHADSLLLTTDSRLPQTPPTGGGDDSPKKSPIPISRQTRIPDEFTPDDDMAAWATSKGFSPGEIDHHTERFVSYWRGEGGPKSKKVNWRQAWQTWLLKETPGRWPGAIGRPSRASPSLPPIMQPGQVPKDGGLAAYRASKGVT